MKRIILISFLFISFLAKAQQYTNFQGYGFKANRLWADSVSIQPSDTVKNKVAKSIAILNNKLYVADGSKWIIAGGGAVDTFLLSTRAWRQKGIDSVSANVNFRVKYTDTALMLIPYLRKADTITLSNRIDARVKYTDTASMLSPYSKLKSVGLLMPPAFITANSPLTSNGIIAVSMGGLASQYLRGDGQLATLPSSSSGGSAVSYYLNGGTSQGTIGGSTYYQMSKTAVLGTGVNFSTTGNGLLTQFITDVADPNRLEIPAGNWNFEMYFNISSSGGNTAFYVELLKYNGSGFTSIASNIGTPEEITGGTAIDVYLTSLAIPQTTLLATDRLAIRVYIVNNSLGRTVILHTQDSHLCQVITNFAGGVSALNGLTANTQYFATGTSGTDFNISSVTATHTFNLPTASATNRGALSTTDWSSFNGKLGASDTATMLSPYIRSSNYGLIKSSQSLRADSSLLSTKLWRQKGIDSLAAVKQNNITLTTTGTSGAATLVGSTLNIPQYSGTNIYNSDGSLTGARTLTLNAQPLTIAGTTSSRFFANGNVGIGTTTDAGYKLDVLGNIRAVDNYFESGTLTDVFSITNRIVRNNVTVGVLDNYLNDFRIRAFNNNTLRLTNTTGEGLFVRNSGNVVIGSTLEVTSAVFWAQSTTQGILIPRMTTTEINAIVSPATGLIAYNTTLKTICFFDGTQWRRVSHTVM